MWREWVLPNGSFVIRVLIAALGVAGQLLSRSVLLLDSIHHQLVGSACAKTKLTSQQWQVHGAFLWLDVLGSGHWAAESSRCCLSSRSLNGVLNQFSPALFFVMLNVSFVPFMSGDELPKTVIIFSYSARCSHGSVPISSCCLQSRASSWVVHFAICCVVSAVHRYYSCGPFSTAYLFVDIPMQARC